MAPDLSSVLHSPPPRPLLTSFPQFPKLPREIRDMIWKVVPLPRRIVYLESISHNGFGRKPEGVELVPNRAPCPILFVCREAFEVIRKRYTLTFAHQIHGNPQTHFNYEYDILCVEKVFMDAAWDSCTEDLLKVRHLALYDVQGNLERRISCVLALFAEIQTLTLIVDNYIPYYERTYNKAQTSNLVFTDQPLDIDMFRTLNFEKISPKNLTPEHAEESFAIDMVSLESYRQKVITKYSRPWELPKIEYKVAICAAMKKDLEQWAADKKWRKEKNTQYRQNLKNGKNSNVGHNNLSSPRLDTDPASHLITKNKYQWQVKDILDSRISRGQLQYHVSWKYHRADSTWYSADTFTHARDLIGGFHNRYPDKPKPATRRPNQRDANGRKKDDVNGTSA